MLFRSVLLRQISVDFAVFALYNKKKAPEGDPPACWGSEVQKHRVVDDSFGRAAMGGIVGDDPGAAGGHRVRDSDHVAVPDLPEVPSSHYYLRSLSRASGTLLLPRFSGPSRGSRRTFLAERDGGGSLGDPPGP